MRAKRSLSTLTKAESIERASEVKNEQTSLEKGGLGKTPFAVAAVYTVANVVIKYRSCSTCLGPYEKVGQRIVQAK